MRDQVFISYSHIDEVWLKELKILLKPASRDRVIDLWDDNRITTGGEWKEEIRHAIDRAKVAVLLVSRHFLASDFIHENELPPLLEAARGDGLTIVWVLLSSCMYASSAISRYQAAHDISKPLDTLSAPEQTTVLTRICEKILEAATSKPSGKAVSDIIESPEKIEGLPKADAATRCIAWNSHLGHIYDGVPPAITCHGVTLEGINVSGEPLRLAQPRLVSRISGQQVAAELGVFSGWTAAELTLPANGKVTLRAIFNPPSGLPAQQFIELWGECAFFVRIDGTDEEIQISGAMTRALYANFSPSPIA